MNRNHKRNVTNHSVRRSRERTGVTKNQLPAMATRARSEGIRLESTRGELREIMSKKSRGDYYICFYANAFYVFKKYLLITVIDADPKFEKNLDEYVTLPAFLWYKQRRLRRKTGGSTEFASIKHAVETKILNEIREFLKERDVYEVVELNIIDESRGSAIFQAKTDEEIPSEVRKEIYRFLDKKYGISADFSGISLQERQIMAQTQEREEKHFQKSCRQIHAYMSDVLNGGDWDMAWNKVGGSAVSRSCKALLRYYLLWAKNISDENEVSTYLTELKNIIRAMQNKNINNIISEEEYIANCVVNEHPQQIRGFIFKKDCIITATGKLFENVTNLIKVEDYVPTGKLAEEAEAEATYELVDLWGQVQWQKDFSA